MNEKMNESQFLAFCFSLNSNPKNTLLIVNSWSGSRGMATIYYSYTRLWLLEQQTKSKIKIYTEKQRTKRTKLSDTYKYVSRSCHTP